MANVVTFWQTHEDEVKFIEYLKGTGDVVVIPFGRHPTRSELKAQPLQPSVVENGRSLLFTLAAYDEELEFNTVRLDGLEQVSVSPILSPVIGYDSGRLCEEGLTPTNVFAYWETRVGEGDEQEWIEKPEWFVEWGKRVFRWLRKQAKYKLEGKTLPMTENAASAAAEGLVLVQD